ncbi:hypothetical protein [Streptomyces sp. HUAS TT7]|uniref:hypothetical protein n=1 Tax=Streptomyces sp. HUAS TT7 TaxID=3447507 RepID=UPI003F656442
MRRWLYRGEEDAAPDSFTAEPRRPVLTSVEAQRAQQARSLLMSGASIPDTARAMAVPERRVISWLVSDESHRFPMR